MLAEILHGAADGPVGRRAGALARERAVAKGDTSVNDLYCHDFILDVHRAIDQIAVREARSQPHGLVNVQHVGVKVKGPLVLDHVVIKHVDKARTILAVEGHVWRRLSGLSRA